MTPSFIAYNITETSNEKAKWQEVGVAFTNTDGSINLVLNALPVNGKVQLRAPKPKTES